MGDGLHGRGLIWRRVYPSMWLTTTFRTLTPAPPSGQFLYFFLKTGPHTTLIPGLFTAGEAALAEALGWTVPAYRRVFSSLAALDLVRADTRARLVYLPGELSEQGAQSPNVARGWRRVFNELPECPLREEAGEDIKVFLGTLGEAFLEAFTKPPAKSSGKTSVNQEAGSRKQETGTPPIVSPPGAAPVSGPTWDGLEEVRDYLRSSAVPAGLLDPGYWRRIDDWLGADNSGVAYLGELSKYLAWLEAQPASRRHRNLKAGFRSWLAKSEYYAEQREMRRAAQAEARGQYRR